MEALNPFQKPRLGEIETGRQFWGYLDTEGLQLRYVVAAHFVRHARHIVEIGGYRNNLMTNFLTTVPETVTVFSLDAEFEPLEADSLRGQPCRVRHVRDYFQHTTFPAEGLAVVALGLEIHGDMQPFVDLVARSDVTVIEIPPDHVPSVECVRALRTAVALRTRCESDFDFSANETLCPDDQRKRWMNPPFWRRRLYVFEPLHMPVG
jgi:hypothetical protein